MTFSYKSPQIADVLFTNSSGNVSEHRIYFFANKQLALKSWSFPKILLRFFTPTLSIFPVDNLNQSAFKA